MDIDTLTFGQVKEISGMFSKPDESGLNEMIGKECIIRTYSAGVWFGKVDKKSGSEVILLNARRLWRWKAKESISLSAVSIFGLDYSGSKVCHPVSSVWLDAIEIIVCSSDAINSINGATNVEAE